MSTIRVTRIFALNGRFGTRQNENSLKSADRNDDGQISFEILNRDILADRIRKTNVDELSDEECREFLKELSGLAD